MVAGEGNIPKNTNASQSRLPLIQFAELVRARANGYFASRFALHKMDNRTSDGGVRTGFLKYSAPIAKDEAVKKSESHLPTIRLLLALSLTTLVFQASPAAAAPGVIYVKPVIVDSKGVNFQGSFTFAMVCSPGGPTITPFSLQTNSAMAHTAPVGSHCIVTQQPMPAVAHAPGCQGGSATWAVALAYPTPNTVTPWFASPPIVANESLICDTGRLAVTKFVFNSLVASVPSSFAMTVTCTTPSGASAATPITVGAHSVAQVAGLKAGSTCSVVEGPLAAVGHVAACPGGAAAWTTTYSAAAPVLITANGTTGISVSNQLHCAAGSPGGRLTVRKVVVNPLALATPASFSVTARCGAQSQALTVPAGGGVSLAATIAAGTVCTAAEAPQPPVAAKACKSGRAVWTTTYSSPATIAAGATATLVVTNALACDTQAGR